MLSMAATPTYRLADAVLDGKLRDFVLERRRQIPPVSWRGIANELRAMTDGEVSLSFEVLRLWFVDEVAS